MRFIMVGGFLGAGKTTTLSRLAKHYMAGGKTVGIVTNDQAQDLVDTRNLRSQGLAVEEVAGACFCCRFDDLMETVGRHESHHRPDIILAEPVGSCTDLVATVVQPLRDLYRERFEVAPYAVIFKPSHGLRILRGQGGGFSPKAAYIFRKQLEEADAILLNRIDELTPAEVEELTGLVAAEHPGMPILRISASTGAGFDALTEFLDQQGEFGRRILDLDYDVYAEGEAELGWLNCSVQLRGPKAFDLDPFLLEIVTKLGARLRERGAEIAHLKAIGLADLFFASANLVSSDSAPEMSLRSRGSVDRLDLIVNARVATDPAFLETDTREVIDRAAAARGASAQFLTMQSFRPGRPQPTHRYTTAS